MKLVHDDPLIWLFRDFIIPILYTKAGLAKLDFKIYPDKYRTNLNIRVLALRLYLR